MSDPPVDMAFKGLCNLTAYEVPRKGPLPLKVDSKGRYHSRSLRFNNNLIIDLSNLKYVVKELLAEPWRLGWLDLSFNKVIDIDSALLEFQELRVLYLHGNCIRSLSDVDKLGILPNLHTITLHGNPIESRQIYRQYVISALPHLKRMDFSGVTPQERDLAKVWKFCSNSGKQKRRNTQIATPKETAANS